ncbi:MAG TPA: hypothetical protein VFX28_15290, partial [Methylomirabilota bacterium]|nr:hypothetical protein [Methylomirabilota bacterium]
KLAEVATRQGHREWAAEQYRRAIEVAHVLSGSGRLAPSDAWMLEELNRRLRELGSADEGPTD